MLTFFQSQTVKSQDNNTPPQTGLANNPSNENKPYVETKKDFKSMHSFGYRPDKSKFDVDFTLQNISLDYSMFTISSGSDKQTKWNDTKITKSYLLSSINYGVNNSNRIGINIENIVSSNTKYTYSASAKSLGKTDYSVSNKGMLEPTVIFDTTLKETNDLKVYGHLKFSPKIGKSSDSNVLRGGEAASLGFDLTKLFETTEFLFGVDYRAYGVRSYEEGNSKSETKNGNVLTFNIGLNFRKSKESSFVLIASRMLTDFSTIQYENSTNLTEIDSYTQTSYILGYQFSMDEDLLFQMGYAGYLADETILRSSSQTNIIDSYTGGGIIFGMKLLF